MAFQGNLQAVDQPPATRQIHPNKNQNLLLSLNDQNNFGTKRKMSRVQLFLVRFGSTEKKHIDAIVHNPK